MVIAMINGNYDIAKRLIEAGADVNQWDIFGQSPLHVAIANMGSGRSTNPLDSDFPQKATGTELVQMLIERGANPNQQTYFRPAVRGAGGRGTTPFLVAVGTGNIDLVKQLRRQGRERQACDFRRHRSHPRRRAGAGWWRWRRRWWIWRRWRWCSRWRRPSRRCCSRRR